MTDKLGLAIVIVMALFMAYGTSARTNNKTKEDNRPNRNTQSPKEAINNSKPDKHTYDNPQQPSRKMNTLSWLELLWSLVLFALLFIDKGYFPAVGNLISPDAWIGIKFFVLFGVPILFIPLYEMHQRRKARDRVSRIMIHQRTHQTRETMQRIQLNSLLP